MDALSTISEVYDLVQRGIEIYNRVKELPEKTVRFDRRMRKLTDFLSRVEAFLTRPGQNAYFALFTGQKESMARTLKDIKGNVAQILDILVCYEKGIISKKYNITFRMKAFAQIWAATVGGTPEKVEAIMKDIDQDREDLNQELIFMVAQGNQILVGNAGKGLEKPSGSDAGRAKNNAGLMPSPTQAVDARQGRSADRKNEFPLAPSPSPAPLRRDYKIIFVDPYNIGRSLVAEAATKLIQGWTLQTHSDWRIEWIHSAGFFLKNQNGLVDLIDNLDYTYKSFQRPWKVGSESWVKPKQVALDSLFDNPTYPYPFKKEIQTQVVARKPRGIARNIFKNYDFVIVLTNREQDNMVKLKEALLKKEGRAMVPRGKGMIVPLGTFLPQLTEIWEPTKSEDPKEERTKWNKTSGTLKVAIKAFLTKEMGWTRPAPQRKQ